MEDAGKKYRIVSLDTHTLSAGDLDFSVIEALGDVKFYDILTEEEILKVTRDAEMLLVNKVNVTRKLIDNCPELKYVGTYSTGYNNVDLAALNERGIVCCNVPGYSTHAVCQHVFALLLMAEGSTDHYRASVDAGDWVKSKSFCYFKWPMFEVFGKTFGVYGYGSIGRAVARVAEAFGMKVLVHSRTQPKDCPYEYVSEDEIFRRSDYLSLHCPLTAATEKMINAASLAKMKKSAVLINTARGGLVDEAALAEALNSGTIRGACLDVLTQEPMEQGNPLLGARNCIITPHIAWGPAETRARLLNIVAENIKAFINGKPQNVVNGNVK